MSIKKCNGERRRHSCFIFQHSWSNPMIWMTKDMHGTLELRLLVINFHLLLMHQTAFYKIENRTHFIMIKHNLTQDNIKNAQKTRNLLMGLDWWVPIIFCTQVNYRTILECPFNHFNNRLLTWMTHTSND